VKLELIEKVIMKLSKGKAVVVSINGQNTIQVRNLLAD